MALPIHDPTDASGQTHPRRHYQNPPVVEAVIDIRVNIPTSPRFEALTRIVEGEEARYPTRQSIMTSQFTVDAATGASNASQELIGYRFFNSDKGEVFQARRDGFAFSKLPPYHDWEIWQPEVRRLWARYKEIAKPDRITRVAVRYINRVLIDRAGFDLNEYFRCFPEIPSSFGAIAGFLMRLEIPQPGLNGSVLIINQGILDEKIVASVPVLLDFDLSRAVDMSPDDDRVWDEIESLHTRENKLFEDSITDRAREIFDATNR